MNGPTDTLSRGGSLGAGDLTSPVPVNGPLAVLQPDALNKLCQAIEGLLLPYLLARCPHWHLAQAQDILQEVHVKVLHAIPIAPPGLMDFDWDAMVKNWLYAIARNTLIDHYRAQRRRPADPLDDHHEARDQDNPIVSIETRLDMLRAVHQALGDNEEKRDLFLRVCVYREEPSEIAEERQAAGKTTLVTAQGIRQEIYRMRKRVRPLLEEYYPHE